MARDTAILSKQQVARAVFPVLKATPPIDFHPTPSNPLVPNLRVTTSIVLRGYMSPQERLQDPELLVGSPKCEPESGNVEGR